MADLNCNVVSSYASSPVYYNEAFSAWNEKNKDSPIYLVQEMVGQLPSKMIYSHGTEQMEEEIKYVIDAVTVSRPSSPYGKAFGKYRHDVQNM
jgi:hypothetical protein